MGALVVRQRAKDFPDTWNSLCTRKQARVVFLGAPHGGTYESVEMMLGTHPIVQQIALLDRKRGTRRIIEIVQNFPSIAELLPRGAALDFFAASAWQEFDGPRGGAKLPDQEV